MNPADCSVVKKILLEGFNHLNRTVNWSVEAYTDHTNDPTVSIKAWYRGNIIWSKRYPAQITIEEIVADVSEGFAAMMVREDRG